MSVKIFIFVFILMASCVVVSGQKEYEALGELIDDLVAGDLRSSEGVVYAYFQLKVLASDELVNNRSFKYKVINESLLKVLIPRGQYYLDSGSGFLSGETVCKSGGATDGMNVKYLVSGGKVVPRFYVQQKWSCGSLGCSFELSFGDETLNDRCPKTD